MQNLSLESTVIERTEELDERLEQLRGSDAERERLLSHLLSAQEDERRRIAGDIHDDPLQLLVAVTMRLDLFRREFSDPAQVEHISQLREWIRAAVAKLRNLMFELRPPILEEEGLAAAIDEYAAQWNLEQTVTIHDRLSEEPPDEQRLLLYRIAQEAFANIRKHSRATNGRDHVGASRSGSSWCGWSTTALDSTPARASGRRTAISAWPRCASARRWPAEAAGSAACPAKGRRSSSGSRPRCRPSE